MTSIIYNSALEDLARGAINFGTDSFYVMLVTSAYTPDKDAHTKRSQVTNEVVGAGYASGGIVSAATVTKDTVNDRLDVSFATLSWPNSTLTARAAVIYKRRGGASSLDELVAYSDFTQDYASQGGTFQVSFSSPLRFQN